MSLVITVTDYDRCAVLSRSSLFQVKALKMQDWNVMESGSGKGPYYRTVLQQQFFA